MKQVLAISGKRGAGKSLLARCLEKYGYTRLSLAGELKNKCCVEFGLNQDQINGSLKESPTQYRSTEGKFFTPREIMIKMGAFYRSIYPNFWLEQLDAHIALEDKVVIDDIRFLNEINFLKEKYDAKFVRLERADELNVFKEALNDISECELDTFKQWDYLLIKELNTTPHDLEQLAEYIVDTVHNH